VLKPLPGGKGRKRFKEKRKLSTFKLTKTRKETSKSEVCALMAFPQGRSGWALKDGP
jgi:hypothetical protein